MCSINTEQVWKEICLVILISVMKVYIFYNSKQKIILNSPFSLKRRLFHQLMYSVHIPIESIVKLWKLINLIGLE